MAVSRNIERSHFGIGRIMEQEVQRMLWHSLFTLTFIFIRDYKAVQ